MQTPPDKVSKAEYASLEKNPENSDYCQLSTAFLCSLSQGIFELLLTQTPDVDCN